MKGVSHDGNSHVFERTCVLQKRNYCYTILVVILGMKNAHNTFNFKDIYIVSGVTLNILQILFHLIPRAIYEESTVARKVR